MFKKIRVKFSEYAIKEKIMKKKNINRIGTVVNFAGVPGCYIVIWDGTKKRVTYNKKFLHFLEEIN